MVDTLKLVVVAAVAAVAAGVMEISVATTGKAKVCETSVDAIGGLEVCELSETIVENVTLWELSVVFTCVERVSIATSGVAGVVGVSGLQDVSVSVVTVPKLSVMTNDTAGGWKMSVDIMYRVDGSDRLVDDSVDAWDIPGAVAGAVGVSEGTVASIGRLDVSEVIAALSLQV